MAAPADVAQAAETARRRIRSLSEQERPLHPDPAYLSCRTNVSEQNREKVVKYINELAEDFGLLVQTAGLACNYFDRFLPTVLPQGPVSKRTMQMIASTCLLIAAKFFDRKLPPLSELSVVHSETVSPAQFAALETTILNALDWQLHVPMPHAFIAPLRAALPGAPFDVAVEERMTFFIDLSVYGYGMLAYTPAEVAAGSLLAAWRFSNEPGALRTHLAPIACACATPEARIGQCATELVRYYTLFFPDTAKQNGVPVDTCFLPIAEPAPSPTNAIDLSCAEITCAEIDTSSPRSPRRPDASVAAPKAKVAKLGHEAEGSAEGRESPDTIFATNWG